MKQGWEIKKLGEICTITMGQSPSSDTYNESDGLPFFQGNADFGKVHPKVRVYCNAPIRIADTNDILISVRAPIGAINIANCKCCIGRGLASIRTLDATIGTYIYHSLIANKEKLIAQGTGSTFKSIGKDALKELSIPVPPLPEQEKIVAELDCLSGIIEKKREQLKELDALAESIFYTMFGDPITNEKGWEVKKLGEVGKVITGNTPSTKDEENYSSNDYCFVKPSDIGKDYVTNIEKTEFYISEKAFSQSRKLCKGSVLTTCIGIIGKVGILKVDATCNQQINAIQPNDNYISEYVAWAIYLTRSVIEEIANAPVVPIINKGEFSNIVIPLPPKDLQQKFADKIESIEKQKELIKQSIAQTEELFNSRMAYYFN